MSKRVYVAGLPSSAAEEQVLKLFDRSGRIWRGVFKHGECRTLPTTKFTLLWIPMRRRLPRFRVEASPDIQGSRFNLFALLPIGYAFLDFDTHDDARDAIKAHDGQLFLGRRLVVQWGYSQPSNEDDDRETPRRSDLSTNVIPTNQRSADNSNAEYGVTLTGLPSAAGYQELRGLLSRHCSGMKAVVLGPDVGNAAGTAHLVFDSLSMARAAMRELNGIRLRGFRIQSWGLTPEEMDNLEKWGRIKLPSSPVSRSSLTRTVSTSTPGSPRRQFMGTRRAQGRDHRRPSRSRSRSRQRSPLPRYSSPSYSRRRSGYSDDHSRQVGPSRAGMQEADQDRRRYYDEVSR
ncbi:hypothetical protein M407DRAFT_32667 [Tulasnella calospora MUT 4182]|uniref:RRM domain-containing protein n=1 Tax=Tulasnella calospora MUT 4182 TaxID=1051891 RepID=A0A0C3L7Y5_9AGAM|nr:hypothetical protein M407DRAFT_32667 [Tulasnella calospora MUT 4182]